MLVCMAIPVRDLLDRLDESAAALEDLLDRHPGRHLLAEYEATVLEQSDASPGHLSDLLARIEQATFSLRSEGLKGPERLSALHDGVGI
jgi:hypothetical protein